MDTYGTGPRLAPLVSGVVEMLRARMRERGLSQSQVALMIRCHPSRVSRALSGRDLPPRHLVEQIAARLDLDVPAVMRQWAEADAIRQAGRARQLAGGPPDGLTCYTDLLAALNCLLAASGLSQREVVRQDRSGLLRRQTVGALLRGERSAGRDVVLAIVRACGAEPAAVEAWDAAWQDLGRPHREARLRRSAEVYSRIRRADRRSECAQEPGVTQPGTQAW